MGALKQILTYTGTNVDISAATAVGAYTSTGDKLIMVDVSIDAVAGNGDYVMYVTRQIGGSGSAYRILPQTTMAAASGLTAISGQSGWITVRNGDVLTCYVDGLAGDTSTPDWTTRWFELADTDISGLATSANLQTVDDNVDAVKAKTDNIPASPAAVGSAMTLTAAYDKAKDDVLTPLAVVDGIVDAIKVQTDKIPASPASAGEYTANIGAIKAKTDNLPANTATALAAIQSDLDNPAQYKADVSGLATTAHVQEVENKIDAIDITVNTIPTNPLLDTAYTAPDNMGIAAIQEKTDQLTFTVPNKVDANADVVLSPEAIENMASAIGEGLTEEVWSSSVRTLTQSPAEIIATVLGADITQIRGDSWAVQLTGVALESTQQFAIKYNAAHPDSAAILFVDSTGGLTVLNGIAQDGDNTSKASLVYDGAILTITVDASITAQLPVGAWQYGIQSIADNGVVAEPYGGSFRVLADVVRAID